MKVATLFSKGFIFVTNTDKPLDVWVLIYVTVL